MKNKDEYANIMCDGVKNCLSIYELKAKYNLDDEDLNYILAHSSELIPLVVLKVLGDNGNTINNTNLESQDDNLVTDYLELLFNAVEANQKLFNSTHKVEKLFNMEAKDITLVLYLMKSVNDILTNIFKMVEYISIRYKGSKIISTYIKERDSKLKDVFI